DGDRSGAVRDRYGIVARAREDAQGNRSGADVDRVAAAAASEGCLLYPAEGDNLAGAGIAEAELRDGGERVGVGSRIILTEQRQAVGSRAAVHHDVGAQVVEAAAADVDNIVSRAAG